MRTTLMLGALAVLAAPEPADACGGCFHGEPAQMGAPDPRGATRSRIEGSGVSLTEPVDRDL